MKNNKAIEVEIKDPKYLYIGKLKVKKTVAGFVAGGVLTLASAATVYLLSRKNEKDKDDEIAEISNIYFKELDETLQASRLEGVRAGMLAEKYVNGDDLTDSEQAELDEIILDSCGMTREEYAAFQMETSSYMQSKLDEAIAEATAAAKETFNTALAESQAQ